MISFSENLKKILEERNISQAELARKANLSRSAITHYINGTNTPTPNNLDKIYEVLGVQTDSKDKKAENHLSNIKDLRPCLVNDKKAYFHKWSEISDVIEPSVMVGGHQGGQIKYPVGIVEYEDGQIDIVKAYEIKFASKNIEEK